MMGRRNLLLVILSAFSVSTGFVALILLPRTFTQMVNKQLALSETSPTYSGWSSSSVPVLASMHLFSVLNPWEVTHKGARPELREMGPYVFRVEERKIDVNWHKQNASVTYRVQKLWFFEEELSQGNKLSDVVTSPNLPAIAALDSTKKDALMSWALHSLMSSLDSSAFVNRTVDELLFAGYEDPLLSLAEMFDMHKDINIPLDKFGWFYATNGSSMADGIFNMHTGADDSRLLGQLHTWNHKEQTTYCGDCGAIKGSAGGLFAPSQDYNNVELKDQLDFFVHHACRSMPFKLQQDLEPQEMLGISTHRYEIEASAFANTSLNGENACFENNLPSGVQNLTKCKMDSPAFLSMPHFLTADPFYAEQFAAGISPQKERHGSYMMFEPTLGVPMEMMMRLQLILKLEATEDLENFENLPSVYLPVLWFEIHVEMTEDLASQLRILLALPQIFHVVGLMSLAASFFFAFLAVFLTMRGNKEGKKGVKSFIFSLDEETDYYRRVLTLEEGGDIIKKKGRDAIKTPLGQSDSTAPLCNEQA